MAWFFMVLHDKYFVAIASWFLHLFVALLLDNVRFSMISFRDYLMSGMISGVGITDVEGCFLVVEFGLIPVVMLTGELSEVKRIRGVAVSWIFVDMLSILLLTNVAVWADY